MGNFHFALDTSTPSSMFGGVYYDKIEWRLSGQRMNGGFPAVAPYLKDPLVLIGFFLFLAFLFTRYLLSQKIIPPLPPGPGFRILKTILLYGFIIGLLLLVFGFAFKYRELVGQERQGNLDRDLKKRIAEATEQQAERDRIEREKQRKKEEAEKRQQQINTVNLLREELNTNLKSINELRKNTDTALSAMLTVAQVIRTPGIKILPVLFPGENLDPKFAGAPGLANTAMDKLAETGLAKDNLEVQKFTAAGRLVAATVDKTIPTVESLADKDQKRYPVATEVWKRYLPTWQTSLA
jgi:Sec-independent protein translocase protein TatA